MGEVKTLTWDEFKAAVETAGVKGKDRIAWIDWCSPASGVEVKRRDDGEIEITHMELD